jgi:hypothetical protein
VGSNRANSVDSASSVLVVIGIILASTVSTPVTSTVHWLATSLGDAINLAILVRACNSVQVSLGGDFKGPAALVRVSTRNMITGAIGSPFAFAINWLATTTLGASLKIVSVWASIAIVQGDLAHTVYAAALILMTNTFVVAGIIVAPRSDTVHRLSTLFVGTVLKLIGVLASVSVVGSCN